MEPASLRHGTRRRWSRLLGFALVMSSLGLLATGPANAGGIDRSFGGDGKQMSHFGLSSEDGQAITVGSKGNFYVAGSASIDANDWPASTQVRNYLARYDRRGKLIRSFGRNGSTKALGGLEPHALAIDSRGRVIVAGTIPLFDSDWGNQHSDFGVMRFFRNGRVDRSFGGGLVTEDLGGTEKALAVRVGSDGAVVIAGSADAAGEGGWADIAVLRYRQNGRLDRGFGEGGVVRTPAKEFLLPDMVFSKRGYLLVAAARPGGGRFQSYPSTPVVFRLRPDGRLDRRFGDGGRAWVGMDGLPQDIKLDGSGRIIAAGNGTHGRMFAFRLRPNGRPDRSFSGDGVAFANPPGLAGVGWTVAQAGRGRIFVGGWSGGFRSPRWTAVRFRANGNRDPRFGGDGIVLTRFGGKRDAEGGDIAFEAAPYRGGRVIAVGRATTRRSDLGLVRYR